MKVLHITPAFYPATYWGGPIYSVYGLCNALAKMPGVTLRVLTTDSMGPHPSESVQVTDFPMLYPEGYEVFFSQRWLGASVSPGMFFNLLPMIRWADVVHLTAVYSFPTVPTLVACRLLGKPVVWSPRGAFQRWKGSRRTKTKSLWERICRKIAPPRLTFHTTSDEEAQVSRERFPDSEVVVILNGIETSDTVANVRGNGVFRLLYLGRLDPKKGIENLLTAYSLLNKETALSWSLTIAGAGDPGYTASLKARISELQLSDEDGKHTSGQCQRRTNEGQLGAGRVQMVGHVTGDEKEHLFQNADVLILPSFTENFGVVVAEALAREIPVIASTGTPWKRLEEIGCGLWVNNDPDSLAKAISRMRQASLHDMGRRGREWMKDEFSWRQRAHEMLLCYKHLLS
jgi:glycosyltransferase involved in cell wall biosynthesis